MCVPDALLDSCLQSAREYANVTQKPHRKRQFRPDVVGVITPTELEPSSARLPAGVVGMRGEQSSGALRTSQVVAKLKRPKACTVPARSAVIRPVCNGTFVGSDEALAGQIVQGVRSSEFSAGRVS